MVSIEQILGDKDYDRLKKSADLFNFLVEENYPADQVEVIYSELEFFMKKAKEKLKEV